MALPIGLSPKTLELKYTYKDLKPVVGAPFTVLFDNGTRAEGNLDDKGEAVVQNPPGPGKVLFGYDQREAFAHPVRPTNPIYGFVPTSVEDAKQALERYALAEKEYMEDNYFPDEVAGLYSGEQEHQDLVSDYEYFGEVEEDMCSNGSVGSHEEVLLEETAVDVGRTK